MFNFFSWMPYFQLKILIKAFFKLINVSCLKYTPIKLRQTQLGRNYDIIVNFVFILSFLVLYCFKYVF